jgi:hypothetical protein
MIKPIKFCIAILISLIASQATAHSNHGMAEPVSKEAVEARSHAVINQLISQNQLNKSWTEAKKTEVTQSATSAGNVWSIQFDNPKEAVKSKAALYIVIDELGNVLSVSHDDQL